MDQERMDKLYYGEAHMDAGLLTKLQLFRDFTEHTAPVITVLCSDNRLRMQMDKLVCDYTQADYHVYGTFNGIDEAVEKARYSDAVIVNTLALKIAPDGLYRALKEISHLGKEVYVILSGWESLPKTEELRRSKTAAADDAFSFCKVAMCRNVFFKPLDGFSSIEDTLAECEDRCVRNYQHLHVTQEEALYKDVLKDVREFRKDVCLQIQREQALVMQIQTAMLAKQKRYEITFTHSTVNINDALERFERVLTKIDIDEVLYAIEQECDAPARDSYLQDSRNAERIAKNYIRHRLAEEMRNYQNAGSSSVSSQNDGRIADAVNDLRQSGARLKDCRFIRQELLDELYNEIERTDMLLNSANGANQSVSVIFDKVLTVLEPKIMAFQYEKSGMLKVSEAWSRIGRAIISAPQNEYETKEDYEQEEVIERKEKRPLSDQTPVRKTIQKQPDSSSGLNADRIVEGLEQVIRNTSTVPIDEFPDPIKDVLDVDKDTAEEQYKNLVTLAKKAVGQVRDVADRIRKENVKSEDYTQESELQDDFSDTDDWNSNLPAEIFNEQAMDTVERTKEFEENLKEQAAWEQFTTETQRLIDYAVSMTISLLYENSRLSNSEIEIQCENAVHEYFSSIIKQLEFVQTDLTAVMHDYGSDNL